MRGKATSQVFACRLAFHDSHWIGRRWGKTPESGRGLGVRHNTDADDTPRLLCHFAQDPPGLGMTPPCPRQFLVMPSSSSLCKYGALPLGAPSCVKPAARTAVALGATPGRPSSCGMRASLGCESRAAAPPLCTRPRGSLGGAPKARLRDPGHRAPGRRARRRGWAGRSLGGAEPGRRELAPSERRAARWGCPGRAAHRPWDPLTLRRDGAFPGRGERVHSPGRPRRSTRRPHPAGEKAGAVRPRCLFKTVFQLTPTVSNLAPGPGRNPREGRRMRVQISGRGIWESYEWREREGGTLL